jgi:signal transduction histidine kinase
VIEYRARVIRIGLVVSWLAVGIFIVWGVTRSTENRTGIVVVSAALVAALVLLSITPWRAAFESGIADWLILGWCLVALLAQMTIELRGGHVPSGVGFLLIPFFAAATATTIPVLIGVEIASLAAYWIALGESVGYFSASTGTSLLAFTAASIFILLISARVRSQLEESTAEYEELAEREARLASEERELSRLYDVSLAIGAGTKLNEVLPELVGRVADAVHARVGLVMQYQADSDELTLMSPIWVAGHTVTAENLVVTLTESGLAQRVFVSQEAAMVNDFQTSTTVDRLAVELDAKRMAAVSLRIEERTIGVLLVGDKREPFSSEDLQTLESLAAPAALVLNQMTRYEAARVSSEKMAEVAQMKTDFVSVVSHELRTPLTSIIGALSTLRRPELKPQDERASQLVDMASDQANRLRTLIEDLLVMSRLEATSLPVRPVVIQLDQFLTDTLAPIARAVAVTVKVEPADGTVTADPDHLARVVTNLVENALKYGGDGDVAVEGVVRTSDVRISVIDHGPGIPYEKHAVIFQRFTQLQPNATRSRGGAGLGLSIVKGLAEAMNGRVWYEPTVGGGATFTVSLPVRTETPEASLS